MKMAGGMTSEKPTAGEGVAYPHLFSAVVWVGKVIAFACVLILWGAHERQVGFDQGVDASLCAMSLMLDARPGEPLLADLNRACAHVRS